MDAGRVDSNLQCYHIINFALCAPPEEAERRVEGLKKDELTASSWFPTQTLNSVKNNVSEVTRLVSEKVLRFQGKNKNLNQLSQQIIRQLINEGYKTQSTNAAPLGIIIQAKKAGILRDIISADRAFTILIAGQPSYFSIHIGIGKWVQNIAAAAAETILLSWLFLDIDVPEMLWTRHVENRLAKEITQIIG